MTSILPAQVILYLPEADSEEVEKCLSSLGLHVIQKLSNVNEMDFDSMESDRNHCIIVHPSLPFNELHQQFKEKNLIIRWTLLSPRNSSLDLIKKSFQENPYLQGVVSAEEYSLLRMGLRLNTHVYPKKALASLVEGSLFFKDFSEDEREKLLQSTSAYGFTAGETLIEAKDPTDFFFILLKGRVETVIFDNPDYPTIIPVEEGFPFGEMSVIDHAPRSGHCLAADECIVLKISAQALSLPNCAIPRKIYSRLAQVLAQRLRYTNSLFLQSQKQLIEINSPKSPPKIKLSSKPEEKKDKNPLKIRKKETKTEEHIEEEEEEEIPPSPFATPTGEADQIIDDFTGQEEYDVLKRKIQLRTDFILSKIPNSIIDAVCNRLFGYLTGSKLAKVNPHELWDPEWFSGGSPHLLRALHMVVCCRSGKELFDKAYLQLQFSQRVVGLLLRGCVGTFLGSQDDIDRYANGKNLKEAIQLDFEIPIDRIWEGHDSIEFLTHTNKDVRDDTLFLVLDEEDGKTTLDIRNAFPGHQIISVVSGFEINKKDPLSLFNAPENILTEKEQLPLKSAFKKKGFYQGETFFLADFAPLFQSFPALKGQAGSLFSTLAILAYLGPDYSGVIWGSKGGAEGAVRAARAKFGIKGAQSAQDLADAVNWADQ